MKLKQLILVAMCLLSFSTFAQDEEPPVYGEVIVNWNNKYLEDYLTLVCDDTYLSGFDLVVPGQYRKDFPLKATGSSGWNGWKILSIKPTTIEGSPATVIRFDGGEPLSLEVFQRTSYPPNRTIKGKVFVVEINDFC